MAKAICRGLAKPDNPIFSQPMYFATPLLLKNLDAEIEKLKLEQEQEPEAGTTYGIILECPSSFSNDEYDVMFSYIDGGEITVEVGKTYYWYI